MDNFECISGEAATISPQFRRLLRRLLDQMELLDDRSESFDSARGSAMPEWPGAGIALPEGGRKIGYARVSTADQRLDLQLDALARAACDEVHTDHGISGARAKRPGLNGCLAGLREGDALVVFKLDRLGRSVLHLADLLTWLDAEGVHFCSLSEGINTATPGGKLVFHVFAAVAEFQRDLIRENTVHGLAAARARGAVLGRPRILDEAATLEAHRWMAQEGRGVDEAAQRMRVSRSTLIRSLDRLGLWEAGVGVCA